MTNKEFADLLIPDCKHDWQYYEAKYPKRNLSETAMVTRFAPSPTGFVHMGSLLVAFANKMYSKERGGL